MTNHRSVYKEEWRRPDVVEAQPVTIGQRVRTLYSSTDGEEWESTVTGVEKTSRCASGWLVRIAAAAPCAHCGIVAHPEPSWIDSSWVTPIEGGT